MRTGMVVVALGSVALVAALLLASGPPRGDAPEVQRRRSPMDRV
jgi:hypothetical protein